MALKTKLAVAGAWELNPNTELRPYSSMTNLAGTLDNAPVETRFKKYPPLPNLNRRRGTFVISSARDSASLLSLSKKNGGKRRSNSCRDDVNKIPKPLTEIAADRLPPTQGEIYNILVEENTTTPLVTARKNSTFFSPYSPLPAIGATADMNRPNTSFVLDANKNPERPRLLRERTYDVLEPKFAKEPSGDFKARTDFSGGKRVIRTPEPESSSDLEADVVVRRRGSRKRSSQNPDAMDMDEDVLRMPLSSILFDSTSRRRSQTEMLEDEQLPMSPPVMDDDDFDELEAEKADDNAMVSTPTSDEASSQLQSSRSLQSLKEDYKGKLKRFWSKF